MRRINTLILFVSSLLLAFSVNAQQETIKVTSSAIAMHGTIPEAHSNYGDNQSIDLVWSNLPPGTVQLALICDDPVVVDAGMMEQPFVHWVMYNIPATAEGLPAGLPGEEVISGVPGLNGAINGVNGTRRAGYFGPRPPDNGRLHAYHFRIYALDSDLGLEPGLNKEQLLEAIDGHVLATGMLMGHYRFPGN